MSKRCVLAVALAASALPSVASAQLSVGARVGTLGIGAEAGYGFNSRFAFRGGLGITKYHYEGDFSDKQFTVDTPPSIWNIGVEVSPFSNAFHLSAGVLHRPQFDLTGTFTGSTDVGNNTYSGTVRVVGNMKNEREIGPFLGLGFGRMTKRGFGMSFDLGVAQLGEGKINFTSATCTASNGQPCPNQSQFQADVQQDAADANKEIATYLKWHPIISLAFHYGFGK
ncbi:MAG: hypothetical protein Q7S20_00395 [Gemmatimonadaceae bacterium]|nr:hypothetical protein [Gemmatimonadaceae bacterium]